jgi:hypothetical protein
MVLVWPTGSFSCFRFAFLIYASANLYSPKWPKVVDALKLTATEAAYPASD